MSVRIVFAIFCDSLPMQLGGPGLERQTVFERGSEIPELTLAHGERNDLTGLRRLRRRGRRRRWCTRWTRVLPHARKIRLAIGGARRGTGEVRLPVGRPGHSGCCVILPLGE